MTDRRIASPARWPTRNRLIFLLSVKAGLRAKEIACLTWRMVTDARGQTGQAIHLEDTASKGRSGRVIPMNEELRTALREYAETIWMPTSTFLIQSERLRGMSPQAIVNLFWRWYRHVGFDGCSRCFGLNHLRRRLNLIGIGRCTFYTIGDRRSDSLYALRNGADGSAYQVRDTLGDTGLFRRVRFGHFLFAIHAIPPKLVT
jgi:integrase